MLRYSGLELIRGALSGQRDWPRTWRAAEIKSGYDVIIVGGGGHGLAAAYYLAKEHGIRNIVVVEKGWIGGGNTGRNTTIVRSNYLLPQNSSLYEFSLKLWENLSAELNYNVMFSQRGVLNLAHSDAQLDAHVRRGNSMRLQGIDAELLDRKQVQELVPILDCSSRPRFPVVGGLFQPRGGTARHDAVAWGYARAASGLGVDIVENCEVTGFLRDQDRIQGIETSRGPIRANRIGIAVAGNTSRVVSMAGLKLPIETHVIQAFVSEPLKPVLDTVVTAGVGHFYASQSDKGELVMGGDIDMYNSYSQRGNIPTIEETVATGMQLFPCLSRLRMMRHWGGIVDMTMDGSPIIGKLPIDGLYLDGGWCYGGFKATPAAGYVLADTIAKDRPHPLCESFALDRFGRGAVIDEKGAGPVPYAH